ncbi:MAG: amino acid adenylation domain-containing protein, partial [Niallia nealsonii]|nr:amino acid adenylation domain-containing protein [Niallia nealsonii]
MKVNLKASNMVIHERFLRQVKKNPYKNAIWFENNYLTYKTLNEKSNSIAHYLRYNGLQPEELVMIVLDKSPDYIISLLGILKAGGAYLPVNPDTPKGRIDELIKDSKPKILITHSDYKEKVDSFTNILQIESYNYSYPNSEITNINNENELAYVMYTSGSTGKPKGVMIEHRNVLNLVEKQTFIKLNSKQKLLMTGNIAFDASTFEIWGSLLNGLCLYLVDDNSILDPYSLEDVLIENEIDILWLTSSLFNKLCIENPNMFRKLKILLLGGDVLSPKHIKLVQSVNPKLRIINGYGPTENTTFTTTYEIKKNSSNNIPIGKPIKNTSAIVIDPKTGETTNGIGELWVGGENLARGYLNNHILTKEKFIENSSGQRIYKTGDLVKWGSNGNLEFIGRKDNQIKLRGYRIELDEILYHVKENLGVLEAYVEVKKLDDDEKVLCAYVKLEETSSIEAIKEKLKTKIPSYMIPSYFIKVDQFPLNKNGKIDKDKLPNPEFEINRQINKIVKPINNLERQMLLIWKEVLNFNNIGVENDFLGLGGHSLKAMKLASRIRKQFNVIISIEQIYKYSTVREMVKHLKYLKSANIEEISCLPLQPFYDASSEQKRMFYLQQIENIGTTYNVSYVYRISGFLDVESIKNAFTKLIQRHESLRTSFHLVKDELVQVITEETEWDITELQ